MCTRDHVVSGLLCGAVSDLNVARILEIMREREVIYQGTIDVASIRIWLRDPVP